MSDPIRLGFIGCGKHALRSHVQPVLRMSEEFRITAVFDTRPEAMADVNDRCAYIDPSDTLGRPCQVSSTDDLLNRKDVDAVVIATPPEFHLKDMEKAVLAGKHILCEKPLWISINNNEHGLDVLKQAANKKLVLTSCHPRRFEPEYAYLKNRLGKLLESFGRVVEVSYRFFYHVPPKGWREKDSLLLDHLNHEIDLVNFIFGHSSWMLTKVNDGYDRYCAKGRRGDDIIVNFSGYRTLNERMYRNEFEITFERGRIFLILCYDNRDNTQDRGKVKSRYVLDNFENSERHTYIFLERSVEESFVKIMENFAKAIRGEEPSYLTPQDLKVNTVSCNCLAERGGYYS